MTCQNTTTFAKNAGTANTNSWDFVGKYVKLLSRITDAPQEFQEAAALFLLSSVVGRKWIFQSLPETTIFGDKVKTTGKLMNLWFVLIGKSRVTRKTTGVIGHVADICKKILGEQCALTEAFTPEALIEQISKMSETSEGEGLETVCFWISDEIAWFFQQLKKKDSYMASAEAFLSKMYDGKTYSRSTIARGRETINNPYLTCLLASTDYLPTLFDELQIRLGFMNRFIYVVGERKERKPLRTETLSQEEEREASEIRNFLAVLAKRTSVTILEMSDEAKRVFDCFERETEERIESEDLGIKEGYCGQLPNIVIRLACLYRLSRMTAEELKDFNRPVLLVEKPDVEKAINYAVKAWDWFEEVVEIMSGDFGKRTKHEDLVDFSILEISKDGKEKHIKEILQGLKDRGITVSQATVYNRLRKLKQDGKITSPRFGFYRIFKEENARGGDQIVG